jgi:outer membrane protein insertion porin family
MNYEFVSVTPNTNRNRDALTIDVSFQIAETQKVFVERIDINGNSRTMDKVIRRKIEMVEGDPFNRERLAKSERAIRDLNYFETVDVKTTQGTAPDKRNIEVNVQEKSTGELSVGAGFSTADGPLADFRIRERNLLGKGQDLLFAATIAGERTEFDVAFTEPYFLDRDLSAGFGVFHSTRDLQDESSYSQRRTGGSLNMGYPLSENWRQSLQYRLERNEITDVQSNASRFIRDQEGERTTSAISQTLNYDTRDSKLFPTVGTYGWLTTELAGLGGDAEFVSARIGGTRYFPIYDDKVVLNILGEAGAITGMGGQDVQINDRFFLGGNNLRGFEKSGVGPRDLTTNDSLGGNVFYRGSVELAFPIGLPEELGIKGHTFTDFGSLWDVDLPSAADLADESSIRAAAGVGLSWQSPLGPVRLDVAAPFAKEDYDEKENFRFSFGTRF